MTQKHVQKNLGFSDKIQLYIVKEKYHIVNTVSKQKKSVKGRMGCESENDDALATVVCNFVSG